MGRGCTTFSRRSGIRGTERSERLCPAHTFFTLAGRGRGCKKNIAVFVFHGKRTRGAISIVYLFFGGERRRLHKIIAAFFWRGREERERWTKWVGGRAGFTSCGEGGGERPRQPRVLLRGDLNRRPQHIPLGGICRRIGF